VATTLGSICLLGGETSRAREVGRALEKAGYEVTPSSDGAATGSGVFDLTVCVARDEDSLHQIVNLAAGRADVLALFEAQDGNVSSWDSNGARGGLRPKSDEAIVEAVGAALQRAKEWRTDLAESERARRLLDCAPVGVFEVEGNRLVYANDHLVATSKYTRAELLSMTIQDLVAPQDEGRLLEALEDRVRGEVSGRRSTYRFVAKDGEERETEITARRVVAGGGVRIEGTTRDVTDEARLARLHRIVLELGEVILGE